MGCERDWVGAPVEGDGGELEGDEGGEFVII
jgi:hypothetical protein